MCPTALSHELYVILDINDCCAAEVHRGGIRESAKRI